MKKESVWDYPRPPRIEPVAKHIKVIHKGILVANTYRAFRVLETSHPPTYYISPEDVSLEWLFANQHHSYCEWKGRASYFDIIMDDLRIKNAGWYYPDPKKEFLSIKGYVSFYASKLDLCCVNDEQVKAQDGDFYGGWITSDIQGPFREGSEIQGR